MKKLLAVVLAIVMVFSFAACGGSGNGDEPKKEEVKYEVVKGITVPEFTIKICGAKVTNVDMAAYDLYQLTVDTVNSSGTPHSDVFVGFKLSDALEVAQVTGTFGKAKIICTDGYEIEYDGDISDPSIFIAISKNGTQFKDGPWFCPASSKTTGDFAQDVAKIEISGGTSPLAGGKSDDGKTQGGENEDIAWPQDPVAEDKTDKINFGDFCFKINGKDVKNADLAGLKIFRITVTTKNSKEKVSQNKYSGYVLKDVLDKLGLSGSKVTVVASDGYKSELSAELLSSELTIIAIEKDKETGENGTVWLAPCSENTSGAYAKGVVEFIVEY